MDKTLVIPNYDASGLASLLALGMLPKDQPMLWNIIQGVTQLERAKATGLSYSMPGEKESYNRLDGKNIVFNEALLIPNTTIELVLRPITDWCFDFAVQACVLLEFGNFVGDTFGSYRTTVDASLAAMNIDEGLKVISENLQSSEPLSWQVAVLGCRALLQSVAGLLWQDPRPTYDLLPGGGRRGKLEVAEDKSKSRLMAYLHQKGARTAGEDFVSRQLNRLADTIADLFDLDAKAKKEIAHRDAVLAVITTYSVLGELCVRTDMKPITDYGPLS